jgi:hypothetical protein
MYIDKTTYEQFLKVLFIMMSFKLESRDITTDQSEYIDMVWEEYLKCKDVGVNNKESNMWSYDR